MSNDLLYQLALTLIPNIGPVQAKILLQHCNAEEIFHARKSFLEKIEGIGPVRAQAIKAFNNFKLAEAEIKFIEKNNIQPLFLTDTNYPQRLLNCYDSPVMLYYKGDVNLNMPRIVAVIGTRKHSDYGKYLVEKLIKEIASQDVLIISGLAFGVDALAHRMALHHNCPTVAVLAHGLDQVYPPQHTGLTKEMLRQQGGLLTEFRAESIPDRHNFPARNRIVAGMSDATVVIETGIKGGSMITASLANGYNKDVFAFPGKITDHKSAGCNDLIQNNKAVLLHNGQQLIDAMGWHDRQQKKKANAQREFFIDLPEREQALVNLLKTKEKMHIDEIHLKSGLSTSLVASAILTLELQNLIVSLPGKFYQLA